MKITFKPGGNLSETEKKVMKRIEDIKQEVAMGAKRIQFFDDVPGIDCQDGEGEVSFDDGNRSIELVFDSRSQKILKFKYKKTIDPREYLFFTTENNNGEIVNEKYEVGRIVGEEEINENVIIDLESGDIIYDSNVQ